ncbi:MAG: hypothetical protein ACKOYM_02580 [Actinomycetes bacterium]
MNLSTVVLLGLAVVWAIVLAPEVLRRTSGMRRVDPLQAFHRQMSSLDHRPTGATRPGTNVIDLRGPSVRSTGRAPQHTHGAALDGYGRPMPTQRRRPQPAISPRLQKRRQDVLICLAAAAVLSLLAAVAFGGSLLVLHLLIDVLLVAYVVLLNRSTSTAPRRRPVGVGYERPIDLRIARPQTVAVPGTQRVAN